MNYLAHIYLSGEDDMIKIGNFIADSVKGKKFLQYPEKIQKGILLHRAIDYYTDTHSTVRKSKQRLYQNYGHYSSVIVDIMYDHFLAANWFHYSNAPLEKYAEDFYRLLQDNYALLPKRVQNFMMYMIRDNWLLSYATVEGIGKILFQMDHRTRYKSRMKLSVNELREYYPQFEQEFTYFFQDLIHFAHKKREAL